MSLFFGCLTFNINCTFSIPLTLPIHLATKQFSDQQIFFQWWGENSVKAEFINKLGLAIIADAKIFNHRTLCSQLKLSDSATNAELILQSYIQWGVKCVEHLIGDFVFAIWNANNNELFLARDPLGQRTIFYYFDPDKGLTFSNLVRPLLIAKKNNALNPLKVGYFLTLMRADIEDTCYQDIKQISTGNYLLINLNDKQLITKRYWSCHAIIKNPLVLSSRDAYLENFREIYSEVIADRLPTHYPAASELSGGLDSSSVTCMAASLLKKEDQSLIAFCHVPSSGIFDQPKPGWNYDDTAYMQAVAQQYSNIKIHFIRDDRKQLYAYCDELHYWLDQPPLNPSNMLWMLAMVEQATHFKINTILCGNAGNFTVSWNGLRSKVNNASLWRILISHYRKKYQLWSQGWRRDRPWGNFSAVSRKLAKDIELVQHYQQLSSIENDDKIFDMRLIFFDAGLRNYSASLYTLIRFLYGVDISDPTADQRIVEFCLRCPYELFRTENRSRWLIRESMQGIVPDMICNRNTRGMQSADWYKKIEKQKNEISRLLHSWKNTTINDYIDVKELLKIIKNWNYEKVSQSRNRNYINFEAQYLLKLLRAVEMGIFIQNAEQTRMD